MTGVAVEDVFVTHRGAGRSIIRDFQFGNDKLDLANLASLRPVSQLEFAQTQTDIRTTFWVQVIEVISIYGWTSDVAGYVRARLFWPDRFDTGKFSTLLDAILGAE